VTLRLNQAWGLDRRGATGFLAIRSSSTAAEKMAERLANRTRR
jgi:hypothetical protein